MFSDVGTLAWPLAWSWSRVDLDLDLDVVVVVDLDGDGDVEVDATVDDLLSFQRLDVAMECAASLTS